MEIGDKVRILAGGRSHVERRSSLTWVTIGPETKISIEEDGLLADADCPEALAGPDCGKWSADARIAMSYPAFSQERRLW